MVIYLPLGLEDDTDLSKVEEDAKVAIKNALDNSLLTRQQFHCTSILSQHSATSQHVDFYSNLGG